jgi:pimeloyl-ACP methyl ester carboxylesterase
MSDTPAPIVLLHGFASSFEHGWRQTGWVDILGDFDCAVPEFDLPGHGPSPQPVDPEAYADVEGQVLARLPASLSRAVGFSAGGEILLRMAIAQPGRFERIALLGVGDTVFATSDPGPLVRALEGEAEPEDVQAQLFCRLARSAGNDPAALSAFIRRPRRPVGEEELSSVTCPVLVVLGERDFAGPADRLVAALPSAARVDLAGVDHFSTPSDFGAIDAVVHFFGLG